MTRCAQAVQEHLFTSADAALSFAFGFSSQQYDRPAMHRLAAPSGGGGKGLAGLDGAAQAGFIRAEVRALGKLAEAIIIARVAPRAMPCGCRSACCAGSRQNREWAEAIAVIADHVRATALAGCTSSGLLSREYVARYFTRRDDRIRLDALAERHGIHRETASAHAARVARLLGGSRAVAGLESESMSRITDRLIDCGMVG